jgi:hypothetical protein
MDMGARCSDGPLIVRVILTFNDAYATALISESEGTQTKAVERLRPAP